MEISNQLKNLFNSNSDIEKIFVSVGHPSQKAIVKMFKANNAERNIKKYIESFRKNTGKNAEWIKIDFVTSIEKIKYEQLKHDLTHTRRNYVEYGFSLDNNWELAFLPEEINTNAFIRPEPNSKELFMSEKNITTILKSTKE